MGRCGKDEQKSTESTGKDLVCKKSSSSHFWEKFEKPVGGWHPPPPLGHWSVNRKTLKI